MQGATVKENLVRNSTLLEDTQGLNF